MPASSSHSTFSLIKSFLVGKPLSSDNLSHERIPKWKALAVLSSDALSSVAYATEEVLIPLSLFAVAAIAWSIPIALAVAVLLFIVTMSYRQTIERYPNGGGAYTVARENLGSKAGLVAGAALLIDYVLTVAVSVAAGVENIAAAFPVLLTHKVAVGIIVILIIMIFNLRGLRESASVFAIPTYIFIVSFLVMIVMGVYRTMTGQVPSPTDVVHEVYPTIPVFLLLRAFASGCSAMTGVEAISNGIPIFKEPAQKNAKITMLWMAGILAFLFISITTLAHIYGIQPQEGVTVVSQLATRVFGQSWMFYVIQASTAMILVLAANTSYADFPRLASLLAADRYLPRQLGSLGDRLVFSNGIFGLSLTAMLLIFLFGGDTHALIPLYAVGVFLSFTLSQSGMIVHHLKEKEDGWKKGLAFNVVGAITTFIVLLVIGYTKFTHGAWIVVILIPTFVVFFQQVKWHYIYTAKQLSFHGKIEPITPRNSQVKHTAILPVSGIHPGVVDSLRYAVSISNDVRACCVGINPKATARLQEDWKQHAPDIPLVVLESPFRSVITPILEYIDRVQEEDPYDVITVIIPEFVTKKWYHKFLHNQTAILLYAALRGKEKIVVTSVRYHLDR